ncbi:hypothetical protein TorRG33x02_279770 [Trema orientale]|uniref:LRR domain containing protein n=1 Tax=Trema orientale TaxID=63057 RepID=A0A2P5CME2_TREOI|nr:hypothetical protein TorRG33x02_279770 [Trema orientale]
MGFNETLSPKVGALKTLKVPQLDSNDFIGQIPEKLFQVVKYNFPGYHLNCGLNFPHSCATDIDESDFEAVVGDFGLAKLVDARKTNVTTQVRETMGRMAS